jgi:hypothetical protein
MTASTSITYVCQECGYQNIWTRDEIPQKGQRELFRDENVAPGKLAEDVYSLPCKNPLSPRCTGRYKIALPRKKE